MLAAIMQPTFLPWLGYFDLIDQAEMFVFLDTVQFEKQSWQQRNRIRTAKGLEWFTVPVFIKGRFGQSIRDVVIRTTTFPDKHIKALKQHYGKTPYYNDHIAELEEIFVSARTDPSLARLNIALIRWLSGRLGTPGRVICASELAAEGQRSTRLVSILRELGATRYLSPIGSLQYLAADRSVFASAGVQVLVHNYFHPEYRQRYTPFERGVSAIDLLFNEGPGATEIIRSGRRPSIPIDEAIKHAADAHS